MIARTGPGWCIGAGAAVRLLRRCTAQEPATTRSSTVAAVNERTGTVSAAVIPVCIVIADACCVMRPSTTNDPSTATGDSETASMPRGMTGVPRIRYISDHATSRAPIEINAKDHHHGDEAEIAR